MILWEKKMETRARRLQDWIDEMAEGTYKLESYFLPSHRSSLGDRKPR